MGYQHLFHNDEGSRNVPGVDTSWDEWVNALQTRNYCNGDPLLDWLNVYGQEAGFHPDTEMSGYDERLDFLQFILHKGREFERVVTDYLALHFDVVHIADEPSDVRDEAVATATWEAMCSGRAIISQAVLWNPGTQTYGAPDLLVRSDILEQMVPGTLADGEESVSARDLPDASWHYRVVDIKYTTLDLLKDGHASSSHKEYMAQVWLYNAALGRIQGYLPPSAYLLGRAWKKNKERGTSALGRLERIDNEYVFRGSKESLAELVLAACDWIRQMRANGRSWNVLPEPSVDHLRPNMRYTEDAPWHHAKSQIAAQLEDLTLIYRVNTQGRTEAMNSGLTRWTDPECSAERLSITGNTNAPLVNAVIQANQSAESGPIVFPERIHINEDLWREPKPIEFFVDFETVNDINDDFSSFPNKGGQALIFMIGCGYLVDPDDISSWTYRVFTARLLTGEEERRVITEWLQYLSDVCEQSNTNLEECRLFHWSPAELSSLSSAYNAASKRHGFPEWDDLPWVDLLNVVIKKEPVTVRGAFGFGLKAIAKAMYQAGLIETGWADGPADGLGAMTGAWWCEIEARRIESSMTEMKLMQEIEVYNEVDCRVMAEILVFLRMER